MNRVEWFGGPLDGAVQDFGDRSLLLPVWVGPDPMFPADRIVCYELILEVPGKGKRYVYSQELTNKANEATRG